MRISILSDGESLFEGSMPAAEVSQLLVMICRKRVTAEQCKNTIKTVCNYFHLDESAIKGRSRIIEYCQARAIIYYRLVKCMGYTLGFTGKMFGRTHATVINGIKAARRDYRNAYKNIFGEDII